jgi:hypothetical protein
MRNVGAAPAACTNVITNVINDVINDVITDVIPAQAGIHTEFPKVSALMSSFGSAWVPACAGTTM